MKKYELVKTDTKQFAGKTLYRIRALIAIGGFGAVGELGGYIEVEANLSQSGNAWVYDDAWVHGNARVYGDAQIIWFSKVGSENGTLTVMRSKTGLFVSRGCFSGTDVEFLDAVENRHGFDSKIGREYQLLIEVARSRIDVTEEIKE